MQPPLLGAGADDQRADLLPVPAKPGERTQQILVALLPDEPSDREDEVRAGRLRRSEACGVDPRRGELDPLVRNALEEERAPRPVGGREEEVDLRDRLAPLPPAAEAPVGVAERDRLPDGEHEAVAELLLEQRGRVAEGNADLGRVHDVCTLERRLEPEVAVTERQSAEVAGPPARQPVAECAHGLDGEVERPEVEGVRPGCEHVDVVAVGEQLPRPELPRVGGVAAQEDDPRSPHRRRNAWLSSGGIARSTSARPTKQASARGSVTSHVIGIATIANAGRAASATRGVSPARGATAGASRRRKR